MTLWVVLPGRWRWLGFVHLALTVWVVLSTGNHYVLDVVAGELLAYSACRFSTWFERKRHPVSVRVGALPALVSDGGRGSL